MTDLLRAADTAADAVPVYAVTPASLGERAAELGGLAATWVKSQGFAGEVGETLAVPDGEGNAEAILFGRAANAEPSLSAGALCDLPAGHYRLAGPGWDSRRDPLAFLLGCYRFDRYRKSTRGTVTLAAPEDADIEEIVRIAEAVTLTRDLVNTPANDLGPAELAEAVHRLADRHGANFEVIIGDDLLDQGFPLVHAVGRASADAPRLIDLKWGNEADPKITLVGKGVCFDSGGLNLKPGNSMALMKKDMGGAANVIGLAVMIMDAKLPVRLRLIVPAVENAVSGSSFRPGDVYKARNGMTVEIGNTDAEGRLVLADALTYADEEKPDLLVDMATLTGAARVALGPDLPPLYCADDGFAELLGRHGHAEADPVWRMPLWDPYDDLLKSSIADVNHISSGAFAGSITAALFLRRFVDPSTLWAHLDVFAWTPTAKPGRPKGGEGQAIRALYALIKDKYC